MRSFHTPRYYLLGSLLLLLLLFLGITFILLCRCFLNNWWWCWLLLLFFLYSDKETNDFLGLDHVVFINLKFTKDVIDFGLGHFVSPSHQSMCEHFGVNFAILIIGLESLDNEVIRVISISCHLLLEHLDHVVIGAGTSDLSKKSIKLTFAHQDTNIVKSSTKVIFVKLTILVDVHQLKAVLVHLELVLGEPTLILALAHLAVRVDSFVSN